MRIEPLAVWRCVVSRIHFEIDPQVVARAAECQKAHACLSAAESPPCRTQYVSLGKFCCLKQRCDTDCIYCLSLGSESICGCPVRVAIYDKYRQ